MRLACRNCGKPLTRECGIGSGAEHIEAQDRKPSVPEGVIVRLPPEAVELAPYCHVPFALNAYSINPRDVVPRALKSTGIDNGCCGSDGSDGPNRSCQCGQIVGIEWSDCWTAAELLLNPDAVVEAH